MSSKYDPRVYSAGPTDPAKTAAEQNYDAAAMDYVGGSYSPPKHKSVPRRKKAVHAHSAKVATKPAASAKAAAKAPSYKAPENYSQYGRPGTNDMGPSKPRTINLGKLPKQTAGDYGASQAKAPSDFAKRFPGAKASDPPARRADPYRKHSYMTKGGGANDPPSRVSRPSPKVYSPSTNPSYNAPSTPEIPSTSPYDPKVNYPSALTRIREAQAKKEAKPAPKPTPSKSSYPDSDSALSSSD